MVRIDMSEYMEKYSVSRLIGAPPGYVGYDEGGQLTEAVRRRPYSVVLLDEIEKAHADVFNMLLQVMDDGRLTDGQGRTVDFTNAVLIMTSNLGSELIEPDLPDETVREPGDGGGRSATSAPSSSTGSTTSSCSTGCRRTTCARSCTSSSSCSPSGSHRVGSTLELSEEAAAWLADHGYDPSYGARPLKRLIQTEVADQLAIRMLEGDVGEGDTVRVVVEDDQLALVGDRRT